MAAIIRNNNEWDIYNPIADGIERGKEGIVIGANAGVAVVATIALEWLANTASREVLGLPYRSCPPIYSAILGGILVGGVANAILRDSKQVDRLVTFISVAVIAMAFFDQENPFLNILNDLTVLFGVIPGVIMVAGAMFAPLLRQAQ